MYPKDAVAELVKLVAASDDESRVALATLAKGLGLDALANGHADLSKRLCRLEEATITAGGPARLKRASTGTRAMRQRETPETHYLAQMVATTVDPVLREGYTIQLAEARKLAGLEPAPDVSESPVAYRPWYSH